MPPEILETFRRSLPPGTCKFLHLCLSVVPFVSLTLQLGAGEDVDKLQAMLAEGILASGYAALFLDFGTLRWCPTLCARLLARSRRAVPSPQMLAEFFTSEIQGGAMAEAMGGVHSGKKKKKKKRL